MNPEDYEFTVKSTWAAKEESLSLKELVTLEDSNNSDWLQLTEEEITGKFPYLDSYDNFSTLQLIRNNRNDPCSITIDLEDPYIEISKLIVISEARIIEFYGRHGEYICTEKAHTLGSINGQKMYISQPEISSSKEITLKFCKRGDTLWLYGIILFVVHITQPNNNSMINFSNVEQILRGSNIHLTENAERAKAFIMNFNTNKSMGRSDIEMLQVIMQQWNVLGANSTIAAPAVPSPNNYHQCSSESFKTTENGNNDSEGDLKQYVDKKFQQLEEKMEKNLQLQLKEFEQKQNEKMDNIIKLLKEKL